MRRPLEVRRPLDGDLGALRRAFAGDPGGWLPEPARWHGTEVWNVRLEAGRLSRVVACRVGGSWHVGEERWRLVGWQPVEQPGDAVPVGRGLPSFTGEIGVAGGEGGSSLLLRGTYTPPAGPLGAAVDAAGLRRVAHRTGQSFLDAVAVRLEAAARQGAAERPPG